MKKILKFIADTATLADKRQVLCNLSAESVDRQGDIVVQSGIDTQSFMRAGGTVLWQHDADMPIAKAVKIGVDGGQLRSLVQFPPAGISPKADEIYGLIKAGVINATSIGFRPIKWEPIDPREPYGPTRYLSVELMEWSFVSVPAMPEATVIARNFRHRSASLSPDDGDADTLQQGLRELFGHLNSADYHAKLAAVHHGRTRALLDEMADHLKEAFGHIRALGAAGGLFSNNHDDDSNQELSAARARRKPPLLDAPERSKQVDACRSSPIVDDAGVLGMSAEQRAAALAGIDHGRGVTHAQAGRPAFEVALRTAVELAKVERLKYFWRQ